MTFLSWVAEILAGIYLVLPWYAGLVLLRGLLWISPFKVLSVQRLLFRLTEPVVKRVRDGFGLSLHRFDPSLLATAAALLLFRFTALRGGLNWLLTLSGPN